MLFGTVVPLFTSLLQGIDATVLSCAFLSARRLRELPKITRNSFQEIWKSWKI
jgi:hypothetical protein